METIRKVLLLGKSETDKLSRLMLAQQVDYTKENVPRFSCIERWSVDFGSGYEVDLKVCSGDNVCNEPLWCEAVLCLDGFEVSCSEVETDLDGEWMFCNNDKTFILVVNIINDENEKENYE